MTDKISTIIVNYNAGQILKACIDTLLSCSLELEVIVVDNDSKDDSLLAIQGMENIRLIRNKVNSGFSAACNTGFEAASANYILFLNPDCLLAPGALAALLRALRSSPDVGIVGGLLVDPDGTEQGGGRRAVPTPWRSFVRAFGLSRLSKRWPRLFSDFHLHEQPLPGHPVEVEAVSGACMLVRREVVEQAGGWDERYFLHCEDLDLCMSVRKNGWKVLFAPDAVVVHDKGSCSRERPIFVEWHKHRGMLRFYRKFFSHQYPGPFMWLVWIGVWLRFVLVVVRIFALKFRTKLGVRSG